MAQEFGLSDEDRFSLLSGIAHDPIQRDSTPGSSRHRRGRPCLRLTPRAAPVLCLVGGPVFTPFFFGASIHIPEAEDIGTPGQLAQWMAQSGVTVTHLTPGMCIPHSQPTRQ